MTDPEAAMAAQLAQQAAAATPADSVPDIDLSAARAAAADVDALLARIAELEAKQAEDAPPPEPEPEPEPEHEPAPVLSSASGELQAVISRLHERLLRVEDALGL